MHFTPGGLTRSEADALNAQSSRVGGLDNLWAEPPLELVRGGDGRVGVRMGVPQRFSGAWVQSSGTAQSVPNNADTVVELSPGPFDTDAYFVDATNRFLVPAEGYYAAGMQVVWDIGSAAGRRAISFAPGSANSSLRAAVSGPPDTNPNNVTIQNVGGMGFVVANDYIEFIARQTTGAALLIQAGTARAWIWRVG